MTKLDIRLQRWSYIVALLGFSPVGIITLIATQTENSMLLYGIAGIIFIATVCAVTILLVAAYFAHKVGEVRSACEETQRQFKEIQLHFERDYSELNDKQKAVNLFYQLEQFEKDQNRELNQFRETINSAIDKKNSKLTETLANTLVSLEEIKEMAAFAHQITDAIYRNAPVGYSIAKQYFEKNPSPGSSYWNKQVNKFNAFMKWLDNLAD